MGSSSLPAFVSFLSGSGRLADLNSRVKTDRRRVFHEQIAAFCSAFGRTGMKRCRFAPSSLWSALQTGLPRLLSSIRSAARPIYFF